jgi:hypothetical protein
MARLTDIIGEIKTRIQGITTVNGYTYNWGTINSDLDALETYPAAYVTFESLEPTGSDISKLYGFNNAKIKIKIVAQNADTALTVQNKPEYDADALYALYLDDVMKVLLVNNGALPLSNTPVIRFESAEKEYAKSGSIFQPDWLNTTWTVRYQYAA